MKPRLHLLGALTSLLCVAPISCGASSTDATTEPDGSFTVPPPVGPDEELDGGTTDLTADEVNEILTAECAGWSKETEPQPAVLQLVVDVSGSMYKDAPGGGGTKWEITHAALNDALSALPDQTSVGLLLYPNVGDEGSAPSDSELTCIDTTAMLDISALGQPGQGQRQALADALDLALVGDYTPTEDAYKYALDESLVPYQSRARKYMLLITDGAPTIGGGCAGRDDNTSPAPIVDAVEAAAAERIQTFVIGSPGSEKSESTGEDMRPWLSEAAQLGGTGPDACTIDGPDYCHLDMTADPDFSDALSKALQLVTDQVANTCTYSVPEPSDGKEVDIYKTSVIVEWGDGTNTLLKRDDIGDCTEGWQVSDDEQVTLCPESCAAAQADSKARITLSFGCDPGLVGILK
jgi:von Willebrand factor type A domain